MVRVLYTQNPERINTFMSETRVTHQDSQGNTIVGIFSTPTSEKQKKAVILCHGFPSNKNSMSMLMLQAELAKRGISSLRFDFYGCGDSEGAPEDFTITKALNSLQAMYDYLKSANYSEIGIIGSSAGGFVALLFASLHQEIKFLGLKSPVGDYFRLEQERLGQQGIREWKNNGKIWYGAAWLKDSFFYDIQNYDGFKSATLVLCPTLIIHGTVDQEVPIDQSRKLQSLIQDARLIEVENADHQYSDSSLKLKVITDLTDFAMHALQENR